MVIAPFIFFRFFSKGICNDRWYLYPNINKFVEIMRGRNWQHARLSADVEFSGWEGGVLVSKIL